MSFLSPTWVEKAKELASAATELGKRASDIAVEAVEGLKAGQRPELVEIEGRTLVLVKQIGEGGYAFVHLARDPQSGARFAVKRMLAQEEEAARNAAAELALLKSLDHPNIVGLVASSVRPLDGGRGDEYLLALEYCAGGSVAKYLVPRVAGGRPRPLREAKLLAIFVDTCKAIAHLHSLKPPVAHRDLKAENVLEGAKGVHKLCDFGSATTAVVDCATASRKERLDAEDEISRMTTMWNRAPEMVDLHRGKRIDHRVDVWALGTLLYTLALRRHPFETQSSLQILNGGYEIPKASETPYAPSTLQLIIEMLAQDPDRRPSVFDITSKAALLLAEAGTDYGEDDEAVEGGGERGGAYGGLGGAAVVADAQPRDSPPLSVSGFLLPMSVRPTGGVIRPLRPTVYSPAASAFCGRCVAGAPTGKTGCLRCFSLRFSSGVRPRCARPRVAPSGGANIGDAAGDAASAGARGSSAEGRRSAPERVAAAKDRMVRAQRTARERDRSRRAGRSLLGAVAGAIFHGHPRLLREAAGRGEEGGGRKSRGRAD